MSLPSIEWEDGYPTDDSITAFKAALRVLAVESYYDDIDQWIYDTLRDCSQHNVSFFEAETWTNEFKRNVTVITFSTGGWSGAEEIIELIEGDFFLETRMTKWQRGGHYELETQKEVKI